MTAPAKTPATSAGQGPAFRAAAEALTVRTVFLADEAATVAFGRALARATQMGDAPSEDEALAPETGVATRGGILYLQGDLGAGKTTLTRGFLRGYGHEGAVKSPTYTLVEPYEFSLCKLYHFDLYRLADPEEFEYLGTEQYFDRANVCLVEWAERGAGWVPAGDLRIELLESRGLDAADGAAIEPAEIARVARCSALTPHGAALLDALPV